MKIEICKGYNCNKKNKELKEKLERIVAKNSSLELEYKECTGHCSKNPVISINNDTYSGNQGIFQENEKKLTDFLINYPTKIKIEGKCKKGKKKHSYGMAVDIGTTIVKATLNDLKTGKEIGNLSTMNKQRAYGSTVLHRWNYINQPKKEKERTENLQNLSDIINNLVKEFQDYFLKKSKAQQIEKIVLAGNTAMSYFYLNENPALTLKEKPEYRELRKRKKEVLLPNISEWVGGDIVSGMTYLGFDKFDKNVMLIDLGTNGEVAVSTDYGVILTAAASAGPAFEGEGFRCGMPASKGAIYKVSSKKKKFKYKVFSRKTPLGLCGSGMLDLIAEMLANNIIDMDGKLDKKYNKEFFLTKDISLRQEEIDYFKESKAAIFATVQTLLQELGLKYEDLKIIYVAGGFGNMDLKKAQYIGLLPPFNKYKFLGNTSLKGAQACLLEKKNLKKAEFIAKSSTALDLTKNHTWMTNYLAALFFPHTDINLFKRIRKSL